MKNLSNTEVQLKKCVVYKKTYSSFLLDADSFSFIISKKLFHTSFKLNIVNSSKDMLPGTPPGPMRESHCILAPAVFYFPIHAKHNSFPF